MHSNGSPSNLPPGTPTGWYSYAFVRLVPRVERGECINVGVVLFARTAEFLGAAFELNADRLRALAPDLDLASIERHLDGFRAICNGGPEGGAVANLPRSERFHWLTAPRSTIIQTSAVHVGHCADPAATLQELLETYVHVALLPTAI